MEIKGPYILNSQIFDQADFIIFLKGEIAKGTLEYWKLDLYNFILDFFDEKTPLLQKTSGTTGDPKSLILQRESMIRSAKMTLEYFNLKAGDNVLLCLPVQYIAGKMMVVRALIGGLNLICVEPSASPLKEIRFSIQFAAMVPLQVYESIKQPRLFEKIEKLIIGGGEIGQNLLPAIKSIKNTLVYETFAMSETYTHFAVRQLNARSLNPAFKVLKGVKIKTDERNCLLVDIPGITNGPVSGNDIAKITGPGEFEWLGRIDNVIKSGSLKIIPEILEQKIREILGTEVVITGVTDEKLGQKIILVVEGKTKALPLTIWMKKIAEVLTKHEVPKEIKVIPEFPRNTSMKVDRIKLQALLKQST